MERWKVRAAEIEDRRIYSEEPHSDRQGGDNQEILIHSCHLQLLALSVVQNDGISSKNSGEGEM